MSHREVNAAKGADWTSATLLRVTVPIAVGHGRENGLNQNLKSTFRPQQSHFLKVNHPLHQDNASPPVVPNIAVMRRIQIRF
jgi:hypothetical protein